MHGSSLHLILYPVIFGALIVTPASSAYAEISRKSFVDACAANLKLERTSQKDRVRGACACVYLVSPAAEFKAKRHPGGPEAAAYGLMIEGKAQESIQAFRKLFAPTYNEQLNKCLSQR